MKNIIFISCVGKKLDHRAKAKDIYISPFFKHNLAHARKLNPDSIYILSAKHGLLDLETEIEPYNMTLNKMGIYKRRAWAYTTLSQIEKVADLKNDEFTFFAGRRYREFIIPHMKNYKVPLEGMGIGKQLKYLKENS